MTAERTTSRPWLDEPPQKADGSANCASGLPVGQPGGVSNLPQDRRTNPRRPHRVYQWIAPCVNGRLPDQSSFYQVQCIDISRTGIGFYTDQPLTSDEIIIAIGTTADAVYVRARVMNSVRLEDIDEERYRIGCEFIERLGPAGEAVGG